MPKYNSCPYSKCPLGCRNRGHHRARYAELRRGITRKKKQSPRLSAKINYEALAKLGLA